MDLEAVQSYFDEDSFFKDGKPRNRFVVTNFAHRQVSVGVCFPNLFRALRSAC
jgi:hypothetical protein